MALRAGPVGLPPEGGRLEASWLLLLDSCRRRELERRELAGGGRQLGQRDSCPLSVGRRRTADLELERTRGIRLFN